jgi:glutamate synthase domain-containing protein 3
VTLEREVGARIVVASDRPLREINRELREAVAAGEQLLVREPLSRHNLGVGLPAGGGVTFDGSVGYYCGGLNNGAGIVVERNCGWAIGEAMAAGTITVRGNAAMSVGASMRGGLIHVQGNAGPRCGVAMKGGMIVVEGNLGYSSAFMAHAGRVICLGDAADAAGDSLWGGRVLVAGAIAGLGVDARVVEPDAAELEDVEALLESIGLGDGSRSWKAIVSAQKLWYFEARDARQWLMI